MSVMEPVTRAKPLQRRPDVLIKPNAAEAGDIQRLLALLEQSQGDGVSLHVGWDEAGVPKTIWRALVQLASSLARNTAVTLVPFGQDLTTQEAADLLGVSRPHLVKLLGENRLGYWKEGTHRRLTLDAVLEYRDERSQQERGLRRDIADVTQQTSSGRSALAAARASLKHLPE